MHFLGVVHPPPSAALRESLASGYALERDQLVKARPMIWGIPVTLEVRNPPTYTTPPLL